MRTISPQFSVQRMLKEYVEQLYRPAMTPKLVSEKKQV